MKKCFFAFLVLSLKMLAMDPSTMTTQDLTRLIIKLKPIQVEPDPSGPLDDLEKMLFSDEDVTEIQAHRAKIKENKRKIIAYIARLEEKLAKR